MKTFNLVVQGEFKRLLKYNIIQVSLGVSVLWLLILFMIGREEAAQFIGLFIFMDITMMTVLLIGVSLFYERQENTLKTLLVTPASIADLIAGKMISAVYLAFQSGVILALFGKYLFDVAIDIPVFIFFVLLIALAHSAIGFTMSLYSKDFNGLLSLLMGYMIILAFPSIFYAFGLIPETMEMLMIISPTHASFLLIERSIGGDVSIWQTVVSIVYLMLLPVVLTIRIIYPQYAEKGVRE